MDIITTNSLKHVEILVSEGYCPVECSLGGDSIVDDLLMDHHGKYSRLEGGVAVRAYRDHFGARREDQRFVIAGYADGDATFACAALAGLLPHPQHDVSGLPGFLHASFQRDVIAVAKAVNAMDVDPVGTPADFPELGYTLLFHKVSPSNHLNLGGEGGVQLWRNLLTNPEMQPFIKKASSEFADDADRAILEFKARGVEFGRVGVVEGSTLWGFRTWYGRHTVIEDPNQVSAWRRPVVLSLQAQDRNITIGCPTEAVAEQLFGEGGLKNVFPKLDQIAEGWGGRETIGGSPRGRAMTSNELKESIRIVQEAMLL